MTGTQQIDIIKTADATARAHFTYEPHQDPLCESLTEFSDDVVNATGYSGDVDTLAFTAAYLAHRLGIPLNRLGVLLCLRDLGKELREHAVAYFRCPDRGIIVFGDLHADRPYPYSDIEYSIEYFVNIETGLMKAIINLQNS